MTTARKLDADLIDHARAQLRKVADRHVREGMGPASAAQAAIRETRALFPHDWHLAVQGDDTEDYVEVWEVEHKQTFPIAKIDRLAIEETPKRLTKRRSGFSAGFHGDVPKPRKRTKS